MNISRKKVSTRNEQTQNTFSVLTYNILADCYVTYYRSDYHYVEDEHLLKYEKLNSKRHLLMMKEFKHFDTDIILLQEVEDWYSPLLTSELQKSGYEYIFCQKNGKHEGCALGYKKERFECVDTSMFHIRDEIMRISAEDDVPPEIVEKIAHPQVALIATLKDLNTGKFVICATTHIIFKLSDPAVQCLQSSLICRKINEVRMQLSSNLGVNTDDIPVIFTGDFNGEPEHLSIQLLKNGILTAPQMETLETLTFSLKNGKAKQLKLSEICNVCKYLPKYLKHPLNLSSAYFDAMGNEPCITSSIGKYAGCLDYIFHTPDLKVTSVVDVGTPVAEEYAHGGPTELFASDHLPLVAEFSY